MTSTKLCFLEFPNRIVVCESYTTPDSQDPETHDSKVYARIIPQTQAVGGMWITEFDFAGDIEWNDKWAHELTPAHRKQIEDFAASIAKKYAVINKHARELQAYQREQQAAKLNK